MNLPYLFYPYLDYVQWNYDNKFSFFNESFRIYDRDIHVFLVEMSRNLVHFSLFIAKLMNRAWLCFIKIHEVLFIHTYIDLLSVKKMPAI